MAYNNREDFLFRYEIYEDYYQSAVETFLRLKGFNLDEFTLKKSECKNLSLTEFEILKNQMAGKKYEMAVAELRKSEEYCKSYSNDSIDYTMMTVIPNGHNFIENASVEFDPYGYNYYYILSEIAAMQHERSLSVRFNKFITDKVTLIKEKMQSKKEKNR